MYIYIHAFWGYNNYADAYFQFSCEDMALEVTVWMSLAKHTQVNWPCNYHDLLIWHHLCAMWAYDSVVEFQFCILWSLVQSPVRKIMVYTADET